MIVVMMGFEVEAGPCCAMAAVAVPHLNTLLLALAYYSHGSSKSEYRLTTQLILHIFCDSIML